MASSTNPLLTSLIPGGLNPTGKAISLADLLPSSPTGQNPLLPTINLSPSAGTSMAKNPYAAGVSGAPTSPDMAAGAPTFPANAGPYPTSGPNLLGGSTSTTGLPGTTGNITDLFGFGAMTPTDIHRMYNDLKKTYGDGIAHAIMDFLQSGAGFNQQAVNNLLATLQPGIERGQNTLMEQFSVGGNRFSSGAEIGLADYLSQVNLAEGQLVTKMYEDALQNYLSVLLGAAGINAQRQAGSPGIGDTINSVLGLVGAGASGLGAAGVGAGGGILGSIIAGLGAI